MYPRAEDGDSFPPEQCCRRGRVERRSPRLRLSAGDNAGREQRAIIVILVVAFLQKFFSWCSPEKRTMARLLLSWS